jgi:hypothetical protein
MTLPAPEPVSIKLNDSNVSGLLQIADDVTHPTSWHMELACCGTLRFDGAATRGLRHCDLYQFPATEAKKSRTDSRRSRTPQFEPRWRRRLNYCPDPALPVASRSRTDDSGAHAESPLDEVCGLVSRSRCMRPGSQASSGPYTWPRSDSHVVPAGHCDDFARLDLITEVCAGLGPHARLEL